MLQNVEPHSEWRSFMKPELIASLRKVIELSEQMIELSKTGAEAACGVECGIIFGTLRDCGYKLKRAAARELEGAHPSSDDATSDQNAHAPSSPGNDDTSHHRAREQQRKVLIVDDEKDVVTYLKAWFQDHGFLTSTAEDGVEAMARLAEDRPSLITLDMSMPEKSGVRVYREIKQSAEYKGIPVIIITAIGEPMRSFLDRTKQVPAPDGFIAKPIELDTLAALVKQLVA
jgi:CheY-like chemotaxis protein